MAGWAFTVPLVDQDGFLQACIAAKTAKSLDPASDAQADFLISAALEMVTSPDRDDQVGKGQVAFTFGGHTTDDPAAAVSVTLTMKVVPGPVDGS